MTTNPTETAERLEGIRRALAAVANDRPTPEQLAEWNTADKAMAQRIRAALPGVPLHHAYAVLRALRVVERMDAAAAPAASAVAAPATEQIAVQRALDVLRVWRDERETGPEAARLLYEVGAALTDDTAVLPADSGRADEEVDVDVVANRASQVITAMGADIRALTGQRDRYRSAWCSARERAQAYGEGILRVVEDRESYQQWLREAETQNAALLRRLAAEPAVAVPDETDTGNEADRPKRAWFFEGNYEADKWHGIGNTWSDNIFDDAHDRALAEFKQRVEADKEHHRIRMVRATTTYTVEADVEPAAGLPAGGTPHDEEA